MNREKKMTTEPMRRLVLFGGTPPLLHAAIHAQKHGIEVRVVSEEMHLEEDVNQGRSLRCCLDGEGVGYQDVEELDPEILRPWVDGRTVGLSIHPVWIFRREVIDLFGGRLFNFHAARLPLDRGAGAYSWRILMGERRGGISIHVLDEGIDTGDLVMQKCIDFPQSCRIPEDYFRIDIPLRNQLVAEFIDAMISGDPLERRAQDYTQSTYWPRLNTPLQGFIDWRWSSEEIERFVCAFDSPYAGASTYRRGKVVHLRGGERLNGSFHPFQAGLVFRITNRRLYVATRDGVLIINDVVDEGGLPMTDKMRLGDRFYTPQSQLDDALSVRPVYTATGVKAGY
ncbi:MAG: hypothetical protein DRJ65_02960 [Acidobacteria bacterium]|nr:MAG: hypothetical protein DRJ65_02960 [Acidobacteriota bacterium]